MGSQRVGHSWSDLACTQEEGGEGVFLSSQVRGWREGLLLFSFSHSFSQHKSFSEQSAACRWELFLAWLVGKVLKALFLKWKNIDFFFPLVSGNHRKNFPFHLKVTYFSFSYFNNIFLSDEPFLFVPEKQKKQTGKKNTSENIYCFLKPEKNPHN